VANTLRLAPLLFGAAITLHFLSGTAFADDLYIAEQGSNTIAMVPSGSSTAITVTNASLYFPTSLAFNSGGDLYIANQQYTISELTKGSPVANTVISSGLGFPTSIAFDSAGNLFVADQNLHGISEVALGSSVAVPLVTGEPYFPTALAFDNAGNLFVGDENIHGIWRIPAGSTTAQIFAITGYTPSSMAFDGHGNLFVAEDGGYAIQEIARGSTSVSVAISSGIYFPSSIAFDSHGNLFVANQGDSSIAEVIPGSAVANTVVSNVYDPSSIAFAPTPVPLPPAAWLMLSGLGGIGVLFRKPRPMGLTGALRPPTLVDEYVALRPPFSLRMTPPRTTTKQGSAK
jgi:streptogramin lyase